MEQSIPQEFLDALLREQVQRDAIGGGEAQAGVFDRIRAEEERRRQEYIARATGQLPAASAAPRGYGQSMATAAELAAMRAPQPAARSGPNTARATSEWANRKRDPLEIALANAQAAASGAATKRMSLEQSEADKVLTVLQGRKPQNLRAEYDALVKANQPEAGDLLRARQGDTLAPIMEALLRGVSDPTTGQPVVGKHIADATTNADTRAEKRRAERLAQGVTGMGFGKDDTAAANALMEQILAAQKSRSMAEMLPVDAAVAGQKMAHADALKRGEWDKALKVAGIGNPARPTLPQLAEEYAKAMALAGDTRPKAGLMKEYLTKGHEPKQAKPVTMEEANAVRMEILKGVGDPKNKQVQAVIEDAYLAVLGGQPAADVIRQANRALGK